MAKEIRVIIVGAAGFQGGALIKMLADGGSTVNGRQYAFCASCVVGDLRVAVSVGQRLRGI